MMVVMIGMVMVDSGRCRCDWIVMQMRYGRVVAVELLLMLLLAHLLRIVIRYLKRQSKRSAEKRAK